jgi:23S rRNA (adenine2503-C2)-methyltransferase
LPNQSSKIHLLNLKKEELEDFIGEIGGQAYRARQVARWIYKELAPDFESMTDLPKQLRQDLASRAVIYSAKVTSEQVSQDGFSRKQLLQYPDGNSIEAVLMIYEDRRSVCVSTQVGCAIGCSFCATGKMGLTRNLTGGEMVEQVLHFARVLKEQNGGSVTNIVFMGMGEPLANYGNLWRAIRNLHEPDFFDLGARHMTVSTAGIAPKIRQFAQEDLPVGLAISLHAATDELRSKLVPLNKKYPIATVIEACREYTEITHRRVTFEYALLEGINDTPRHARELGRLLHGLLCHINLIPVNPVEGSIGVQPSKQRQAFFKAELDKFHIPNTIRLGRGADIKAACGQLKTKAAKAKTVKKET